MQREDEGQTGRKERRSHRERSPGSSPAKGKAREHQLVPPLPPAPTSPPPGPTPAVELSSSVPAPMPAAAGLNGGGGGSDTAETTAAAPSPVAVAPAAAAAASSTDGVRLPAATPPTGGEVKTEELSGPSGSGREGLLPAASAPTTAAAEAGSDLTPAASSVRPSEHDGEAMDVDPSPAA
jgi:hypothetical protein